MTTTISLYDGLPTLISIGTSLLIFSLIILYLKIRLTKGLNKFVE